nr:hypothetical protein [uncultured Pseudomonas sp.]
MSDFDDEMTDNISIIKTTGERFEGLKASVQRDKIFFNNSTILVEPRDLVRRTMSNGGIETFEVIDPGFFEEVYGFAAHYQMVVRKLGIPEAERAVHSITYNFSGSNARVNNHSVDNSVNSVTYNAEVAGLIQALRNEVSTLGVSPSERSEALEVVDEIENQLASNTPKRTIIKSLLGALPHIESVTSIGASILGVVFPN